MRTRTPFLWTISFALVALSTNALAQEAPQCDADDQQAIDSQIYDFVLDDEFDKAFDLCNEHRHDPEPYDACVQENIAELFGIEETCARCFADIIHCNDVCDANDPTDACAESCVVDDFAACTGVHIDLDKLIDENENDANDTDVGASAGNPGDSATSNEGKEDDIYGSTCTPNSEDCNEDGTWDTTETGGRVGSCSAGLGLGSGGGLAAMLMTLGLVSLRRKTR